MDWTKDDFRQYQRRRNQLFRAYIAMVKAYFGCSRCGSQDRLEFHHEDPATKSANVAWMANSSLETLWIEIGKCELLCSRCHRLEERSSEDFREMGAKGLEA